MTKKDIVRAVTEESGLQRIQVAKIMQTIFDSLVKALVEEGRVELRNFGVFAVRRRKARRGRNPRTNETIMIPERYAVSFTPGKVMEERVQEECRKQPAVREG